MLVAGWRSEYGSDLVGFCGLTGNFTKYLLCMLLILNAFRMMERSWTQFSYSVAQFALKNSILKREFDEFVSAMLFWMQFKAKLAVEFAIHDERSVFPFEERVFHVRWAPKDLTGLLFNLTFQLENSFDVIWMLQKKFWSILATHTNSLFLCKNRYFSFN